MMNPIPVFLHHRQSSPANSNAVPNFIESLTLTPYHPHIAAVGEESKAGFTLGLL